MLLSDLNNLNNKFRTVFHGFNIILEDYGHETNYIGGNISIYSTRQCVLASDSYGPTIAKRYSMVPVEGEDKYYWFARILLLFHLKMKTTLDPDNAEFLFVRYFDLTPLLDNVDIALTCVSLREATDD